MPRISNKMSTMGKLNFLFSVLFIFGLSQHFANCVIEFSGFGEDEIRLEMQVYNMFESLHNKYQIESFNESSEEEWWQNKINKHGVDSEMKSILNNLKSEISCVKSLVKGEDDEDRRLELVHFGTVWTVQFIATKYSYIYARGHSYHKKDEDKAEIAENCAYLSAFFSAFGANPTIRDLIHPKIFENIEKTTYMRRYGSKGDKLMFSEFSEKLDETIFPSLFSNQQENNVFVGIDEHTNSFDLLNSDFGTMLFGNEKSVQPADNSISDEQLWNLAGELVDAIKSTNEKPTTESLSPPVSPKKNIKKNKKKSTLIDVLRKIEMQKAKPHLEHKMKEKSEDATKISAQKPTSEKFNEGNQVDLIGEIINQFSHLADEIPDKDKHAKPAPITYEVEENLDLHKHARPAYPTPQEEKLPTKIKELEPVSTNEVNVDIEKKLNDLKNGFTDGSTLDLVLLPGKGEGYELRFVRKKGGELFLPDGTKLEIKSSDAIPIKLRID